MPKKHNLSITIKNQLSPITEEPNQQVKGIKFDDEDNQTPRLMAFPPGLSKFSPAAKKTNDVRADSKTLIDDKHLPKMRRNSPS